MSPTDIVRLERLLGTVLRTGVGISTAMLAGGLAWWMFDSSAAGATGLLRAGLFVLMATPMARVLISFVDYVYERDWPFVAITLGVLAVLATTVWAAWSAS